MSVEINWPTKAVTYFLVSYLNLNSVGVGLCSILEMALAAKLIEKVNRIKSTIKNTINLIKVFVNYC